MTYNVFGGTLSLAQLNLCGKAYFDILNRLSVTHEFGGQTDEQP